MNEQNNPQVAQVLQVNIKTAAQLLGYCEATVYALLARGELKSVGRRKMRRIPIAEIQAWQERNLS